MIRIVHGQVNQVCPRPPLGTRDRGAVAVEMALIMPLLVLLLFGIVDFGRALHTQITLTQGAREGARAAAVQDPDVALRVDAATQSIGPVSTIVETACGSGLGTQAVVRVDKSFVFVTPLGAIASLFGGTGLDDGSIAMNGRGVMRCG